MFREIEKFIKKSFGIVPSPTGQNNFFANRFKKIVQALVNSYGGESEPLKGRLREISTRSESLLEKILCIKNKLESQFEKELTRHIKSVFEPMRREIQKIHLEELVEEEASLRFGVWETKAKLWLALENKVNDRTEVIKTITKLLFVGMKESIDQDLKVIANYQSQMISQLAISTQQQQELLIGVESSVSAYIEALASLKETSPPFDLKDIEAWKAHIDERRNLLFENALQQIDAVVETFPA